MPYAEYHRKERERERHKRRYNYIKKNRVDWNVGENNPMYGKHHTEETKQNIKRLKIKQFKEHPEIIEKIKQARAIQIIPKINTLIEIKIQNFLKILGIEFFTHFYIKEIEHKYRCDIFIPSIKLVIEADGDYWHANPKVYSKEELNKKQKEQKERDIIRTKELIEKGYNVLRIWEKDIKKMNLNDFQIKLNSGGNKHGCPN